MEHRKKRVFLLGGLGVIGRILTRSLRTTYDLIISDLAAPPEQPGVNYIHLDIADHSQVMAKTPRDVDVVVNLTAIPKQPSIVNETRMRAMTEIYVRGSYNVFSAAAKLEIPKVIFASTNHVTDCYEKEGRSLLGREITANDYPFSTSVYGTMKLCGENIGRVFTLATPLSVICLRIGTVHENERGFLAEDPRSHRTILSHSDLVELFKCAIECKVRFGIYYGVSDNPGRPWSIQNAKDELGFKPRVNSRDLLKDNGHRGKGP